MAKQRTNHGHNTLDKLVVPSNTERAYRLLRTLIDYIPVVSSVVYYLGDKKIERERGERAQALLAEIESVFGCVQKRV